MPAQADPTDGTAASRARAAARAAGTTLTRAGRLAASSRGRIRRGLRRGRVPGLLSIVVPCYDVEDYLDECLASLRFQDYRDVEIIVVDDGSPDNSAAVARSHMRRDLRVRLVRRPNGGLSAARNTGAAHARGEFLTFVDSDDVVAPDAYGRVVASLRSTGSDFAVSLYDRIEIDQHRPAQRWIRHAHARRRLGTTVDEFPEIMVNAVAWSKVYRRAFWDEAGLSFPEGKLYEDQPVSSAAYASARAFDVLPEVTVSWRIRHDKSSISQQKATNHNLAAHNEIVESSLRELARRGKPRAAERRATQLLAYNMQFFTQHILQADDEFWGLLQTAIGRLRQIAPPDDQVRTVAAQNKVVQQLVLDGRRSDAEAFLEQFGEQVHRFRSTLTRDGVRVELPLVATVPDECALLSEQQLALFVRVLRAFWQEGTLTVSGWAFIRNLDLAPLEPRIEVGLVGESGEVPMRVSTHSQPRADEQELHWYADYSTGGFTAVLDRSDLPPGPGSWRLRVRFAAGPVVREDDVTDVSVAGSAAVEQVHLAPGGARYVVGRLDDGVFGLVATDTDFLVDRVDTSERGMLHLQLHGPRARSLMLAPVQDPRRPVVTMPVRRVGQGRFRAGLALERVPISGRGGADTLGVFVRPTKGAQPVALAAPPDVDPVPLDDGAGSASCAPARYHDGTLVLVDPGPVATGVDLRDEVLRVRCVGGRRLAGSVPVLAFDGTEVKGSCEVSGTGLEIRVPLVRSVWGRDGLALPPGKYSLGLRRPDGTEQPLLVAQTLLDTLPRDLPGRSNQVRVEVFPRRPPELALLLRGPLAEDERGNRNQRRLREECRVGRADADSVFFRALYGEAANCNMLGVHQELRRRGSHLRLLWSVTDYSVPVPPGGEAVIEGSRAWHEALTHSRYHMVNVHQLPWFIKPEGQVMIETMHGYPYKVMGHEWWEKGRFPASQVLNYDRRAREWDYFVSPATYATPLLRKAFLEPAGSTAEVLEIGYPRNDVLQGEPAARLREEARRMLGIRPDQTVVLYAPTFRDYLSADDMAAAPVDFFRVRRAARKLGDDYVFLMRGHAFNARARSSFGRASNIVDVTTHPDVNELIAASDVAVLDYSSLRFDYAITGKPMVFLVPDLEKYDRARGGVIAFGPTAPGPHVATTREVIQHLRNLSALRRDYAAAIARFRADYVDLDDGHASARLVDAVFVPRGDAPPGGEPGT